MLDETGHERLAAMEDALDVNREDALPFFLGDFQRGLVFLVTLFTPFPLQVNGFGTDLIPIRRPRIINQHIQPPKLLKRQSNHRLPVLRICHIHLLENQVLGILRRNILASFDVNVGDDDLGAFFAEAAGDGCAETGAASCFALDISS